jgi:hypothetical protein
MPTTFVTCYFEWTGDAIFRTKEWRFQHFRTLLESGIRVYLCTNCAELISWADEYPTTLYVHYYRDVVEIPWLKKPLLEYNLPAYRNEIKDTHRFIALQNLKTFFIHEAIQKNVWSTDYFAWIDMNVFYVFQNVEQETQKKLKWIENYATTNEHNTNLVVIPGFQKKNNALHHTGIVVWRFSGGFFWGHRKAFVAFHQTVEHYWDEYFENICQGTLYWELNYWAWLEDKTESFRFHWFPILNHDMNVNIPLLYFSRRLMDIASCTYMPMQHKLPEIPDYHPSSMSHLLMKTKDKKSPQHYLLVRYVNYHLMFMERNFYYKIMGPVIDSRNLLIRLGHKLNMQNLKDCKWLTVDTDLKSRQENIISSGLEDLRMWTDSTTSAFGTTCKVIGSNINYTDSNQPQIVVGDLDLTTGVVHHLTVFSSPCCQKNWIPFNFNKTTTTTRFIYKWTEHAAQCGTMNTETGEWNENVSNITHSSFFLKNAKGSSRFITGWENGTWIGLVHSTEKKENSELIYYYHNIVIINDTHVCQYSAPFYFDITGIEYCIGFWWEASKYHFWISRKDDNPFYFSCNISDIPLHR